MNRWHVLAPALLASASLVIWGDPSATTTEVVTAAPARPPIPRAAPSSEAAAAWALPELIDRKQLYPTLAPAGVARDLFAGRSWTQTLEDAAQSLAPSAPDLPFSYIGKKHEGGIWEVFLAKGETTMVLKEGDVAEQVYQVVRIAPPLLTMEYLPMNHVYSVPIGEAE